MVLEKQIYTLDDLLAMGSDSHIEIVSGELIQLPVFSTLHQLIISNVFRILSEYCHRTDIGISLTHGLGYLMDSDIAALQNVFVPDVSFISAQSIPANWDLDLPHPGAPDLAVEIFSPEDNFELLLRKVRTYLDKGILQVWVVYPKNKELYQYTNTTPDNVRVYKGSQTIAAKDLFPGIEDLTTDAIFHLPEWILIDEEEAES